MKIIQERLDALNAGQVSLDHSSHSTFEEGHCAMEVVAWLAGEGHTDAPRCASKVLTAFTIALNDSWDQGQRQKLAPFLPRMVGTRDDGQDEARSYLALDWLIRTYTPVWLDLAGLSAEAQKLRSLRRIVDLVAANDAGPVVRETRKKAGAARTAAEAAAAAWDAAEAAAWGAARAAARTAAGTAAGAAARDAAEAAAEAAAGAAAEAAAWGAAAYAAGAPTSMGVTWDATPARAAAALQPTVETLQVSALELLDRMIDPKELS